MTTLGLLRSLPRPVAAGQALSFHALIEMVDTAEGWVWQATDEGKAFLALAEEIADFDQRLAVAVDGAAAMRAANIKRARAAWAFVCFLAAALRVDPHVLVAEPGKVAAMLPEWDGDE